MINGIDMNYMPLMKEQGLKWKKRNGDEITNLFNFFKERGINALRLRIWVGESGPSRLPYALRLAEEACEAGYKIQPVIFLSDRWSDLYKQPAPKEWASLSLSEKIQYAKKFVEKVIKSMQHLIDHCIYFQIGNEIDYGICGIFAPKKKRKDIQWLREKIWKNEAKILLEVFNIIKNYTSMPVSIHLAKWYDSYLIQSFLVSMENFGLEYEICSLTFYPSHIGAPLSRLKELAQIIKERDLRLAIAEYAYPSSQVKGQFWFLNNASPGYPLTPKGQAMWIKDFLQTCKKLNIFATYYWSPELYLTKKSAKQYKVSSPPDMPLDFGWGPLSLFYEDGTAKPATDMLYYGYF